MNKVRIIPLLNFIVRKNMQSILAERLKSMTMELRKMEK